MTTRRFKAILTNRVKNKKNNKFINKSNKVTSLKVIFNGKNSTIEIGENTVIDNCKIIINGDNCHLIIGKKNNFKDSTFSLHSNSKITVGDNNKLPKCKLISSCGGAIIIGSGNSSAGNLSISCNKKNITITSGCLFAIDVSIRNHDGHKIFNDKKELLTKPSSITIDKSWVGDGSMILKGVNIPFGCVVGARSLITKSIQEEKCLVVADNRVLRKNITWEK